MVYPDRADGQPSKAASVLAITGDDELYAELWRVAAAAGITVDRMTDATVPGLAGRWRRAPAILLGADCVGSAAAAQFPQHHVVIVVSRGVLGSTGWHAALTLRAAHVVDMTSSDDALLRVLTASADDPPLGADSCIIAVTGALGGSGATVTALATAAAVRRAGRPTIIVDGDQSGTGLSVAAGVESAAGAHWGEINAPGGRLTFDALAQALPAINPGDGPIPVLGVDPHAGETDIDVSLMDTVLSAVRHAGAVAVVDVPRHLHPAAARAISRASLTVIVTPAHVRGCYGATARARGVDESGGTPGLVVRGPSPGGLGADDIGDVVAVPVIAAMRPEPGLDRHLDAGRIPGTSPRSPLRKAAKAIAAAAGAIV